jgi:peptide/nickel transport system permease protein
MRVSKVDPATAYAKKAIGNPIELQIENIRISMGFDKPLLVYLKYYA